MEKYIDRPYSQLELHSKREILYKTLNLSNKKAWHKKTKYFYLVKQNGMKEKEMNEQNCCDVGNCSVTWKLLKTPKEDKTKTLELINEYMTNFYDEPIYLTPYLLKLEDDFYNWLYK